MPVLNLAYPSAAPMFHLEIDYDYNPGDSGQTGGPPEKCYEPEGEEITINSVHLIENGAKVDVTSLITSELCEGVMEVLEEEAIDHWEGLHDEGEPPEREGRHNEDLEFGGRLYP